jgi:hypothetical protein
VRVKRCEFCGTPLQGRRDAKYCSVPGRRSCRDRAFHQRLADVGEVLAWAQMSTKLDGVGASAGGIALGADRVACEAAFLAALNARQAGRQAWEGRLQLIREKAPGAFARLGAALCEVAVRLTAALVAVTLAVPGHASARPVPLYLSGDTSASVYSPAVGGAPTNSSGDRPPGQTRSAD